jgi:carboxymethylenebutenolidase
MNPLDTLNVYQRYVVEEFADDYREHHLSRRDLLRKVLFVTGSVPLTASVLLTLGCARLQRLRRLHGRFNATATTGPRSTEAPATPPPASGPGVTVQPTDPAIQVRDVSYKGPASDIKAYLARPATGTTFPALVIIHENRGLNEHTKDIARRYAKEGFAGLLCRPRLMGRRHHVGHGRGHRRPARANADDLVADLVASVEYLKQQPFVKPTPSA